MNFQVIKRTLGWLLIFEAIFFLVPMLTALVYGELEGIDFLLSALICLSAGFLLTRGKTKNNAVYAKEGFVIVALSWIVMSLFGALPFWFSGVVPSYVDALFETVSGFTTTGASILYGNEIEGMPKCLLMWRSFTHWVGGMGVLVFILAFLPLSGGQNINIMRAESPGPEVSKLVPKIRQTAGILYLIYAVMTVLMFVMLVFDMPVFDALTTAFATAGTGGFAIKGDSFASYSTYSQIVVTVFMILFSVNFASYYLVLRGRFKESLTEEVRAFFIIVIAAISLITLNLCLTDSAAYEYTTGEAIKHSAFSVASVMSTTGFATANFDIWPVFSKTVLVILMFVGACAGSTGGGMKVSRMLIWGKGVTNDMKRMLHPKQVKKITMDKRVVGHEVVRGANTYLVAYFMIYIASMLLIALDCQDLVTNFTSVATTINNVGPGLGAVGPNGNFAGFTALSKLVYIFDMLAGRLEVFPMLLLFAPNTWKK
ncbi:MAG: TrkH family potassium uptake protein [Clostridia bacterium]|nr:TrkH family potassium uptake protein [Clostridia bacterium]